MRRRFIHTCVVVRRCHLAVGNRIRAAEEALSGTDLVMLAGDDAVHLWNRELTGVQPVEVVFVDQPPVTDE